MSETLVVNEIYLSLQGESTFAGLPCIFIRLTACDLRCSYCDTAYAFSEGKRLSLAEVIAEVNRLANRYPPDSDAAAGKTADHDARRPIGRESPISSHRFRLPLVELTGGEPLLQKHTIPLMKALCDAGFTLLLETSGAHDIGNVDPRVRRIMDLK